MPVYESAFTAFGAACQFQSGREKVDKSIACFKYALKLDRIISSDLVAEGTRALSDDERREFAARYARLKQELAQVSDEVWLSRPPEL
jgi:adenosyl cobinamide kinase/adenosyl cobinamide phosphate guanylyltransferase